MVHPSLERLAKEGKFKEKDVCRRSGLVGHWKVHCQNPWLCSQCREWGHKSMVLQKNVDYVTKHTAGWKIADLYVKLATRKDTRQFQEDVELYPYSTGKINCEISKRKS